MFTIENNKCFVFCKCPRAINMSKINDDKGIPESEVSETRSAEADQILDADATIKESEKHPSRGTDQMDPKLDATCNSKKGKLV